MTLPVRLDHPQYLPLLALIVPVALMGVFWLRNLTFWRRWLATGCRVLLLTCLILAIAGLEKVSEHRDMTLLAVVDDSESVRRFASLPLPLNASPSGQSVDAALMTAIRRSLNQAMKAKKADDRLGLVTYDGRASVASLANGTELDTPLSYGRKEGTDTASALRLAMAMFPADSGKRLLLVWDGNDTAENGAAQVIEAAREAKAAGIPVDVAPVDYQLTHEVMVQSLIAPTQARQGQTVPIRVVLSATGATSGKLFIKHDGQKLPLSARPDGSLRIEKSDWPPPPLNSPLSPPSASIPASAISSDSPAATNPPAGTSLGDRVCVKIIQVAMNSSGPNRFEAYFEPDDGYDQIPGNNQGQAFTIVHGQGQVLVVSWLPESSAAILPGALTRHGVQTRSVSPAEFPASLSELLRYDAVVLHNVPQDQLTRRQIDMLATYVHDLGGGLVMIGGPDSFGAGGWTNTPIDRLLPVDCQIPSQTVMPSGALVIVMDHSGSMAAPAQGGGLGGGVGGGGQNKQEVANEAAVQAIATLFPQDLVGVVAFDNSTTWVVGRQSKLSDCSNPKAIFSRVRSIVPEGGTNIYPGLEQAYLALAPLGPEQAAVKHVILLTDGQSQDGDYPQIVAKMNRAGITLSTVGVGADVNGQLLQTLAQTGGGHYYPVMNPAQLPQIFIKEARTIRRNLIKEQPFTPTLNPTGSPLVAGMSSAPTLAGLVLTGPKNDPRIFTPLLSADGEPLLAHWQVGLGRCVAFTSDATNRWAAHWLNWGGYSDFWNRVVRYVSRPTAGRNFDLSTVVQGDRMKIRLSPPTAPPIAPPPKIQDKKSDLETSAEGWIVAGQMIAPNGQRIAVTLQPTEPGVYEAEVPATDRGDYLVSLLAKNGSSDSAPVQTVLGGVTRPVGPELRTFQSNRAMVQQVAAITGGRVIELPQLATMGKELFARPTGAVWRSMRPLTWPLLVASLTLLLIDVAIRRIAWDFPAIWHWVARRFDALIGWTSTAKKTATVTATSQAIQKLTQRKPPLSSPPSLPFPPSPPPPLSSPHTSTSSVQADRTFEASLDGTNQAAEYDPSLVLKEESSSAKDVLSQREKPNPHPALPSGIHTTGRLLQAKQRARQNHPPSPPSPPSLPPSPPSTPPSSSN